MTRKITTVILTAITLFAIVPNVRAEIASKAYVDDTENNLIYGTTTPSNVSKDLLSNGGGVVNMLQKSVALKKQWPDGVLTTSDNGDVMIAKQLNLSKLLLPTPVADCETNGCLLMYRDGRYVWEVIGRDTNETISMTGAVADDSSEARAFASPSTCVKTKGMDCPTVLEDE